MTPITLSPALHIKALRWLEDCAAPDVDWVLIGTPCYGTVTTLAVHRALGISLCRLDADGKLRRHGHEIGTIDDLIGLLPPQSRPATANYPCGSLGEAVA